MPHSPPQYPDPSSADREDINTVIRELARDTEAEANKISTEEAAKTAAEEAAKEPAGEADKAAAEEVVVDDQSSSSAASSLISSRSIVRKPVGLDGREALIDREVRTVEVAQLKLRACTVLPDTVSRDVLF